MKLTTLVATLCVVSLVVATMASAAQPPVPTPAATSPANPASPADIIEPSLPEPPAAEFYGGQPPVMMAPSMVSEQVCCPVECVDYRTLLSARRMIRKARGPQQEVVLCVDNPADCDCKLFAVPVCIPCCCVGEPCVDSRDGLLGRGVATYTWDCGFTAKVVFRARGDVLVTYSAR